MKSIELSFEFFPPKTAAATHKLCQARNMLARLNPQFVSVTFGAGGSAQQGTFATVLDMVNHRLNAVPHLSCISASREAIRELLASYRQHNIGHVLALRGDNPPSGGERGEFRYTSELVEFIRNEYADGFRIDVAAYPECHPNAPSLYEDLNHFAHKVYAGANAAITQYFYNADAYFRFVDDAQRLNIDIPITPGIMPITDFIQLMRFSRLCGAEVPRWIVSRLQGFGDDKQAIRAFGIDVVLNLCERLIKGGAPGLHFYTLNCAIATQTICQHLLGAATA